MYSSRAGMRRPRPAVRGRDIYSLEDYGSHYVGKKEMMHPQILRLAGAEGDSFSFARQKNNGILFDDLASKP